MCHEPKKKRPDPTKPAPTTKRGKQQNKYQEAERVNQYLEEQEEINLVPSWFFLYIVKSDDTWDIIQKRFHLSEFDHQFMTQEDGTAVSPDDNLDTIRGKVIRLPYWPCHFEGEEQKVIEDKEVDFIE
jgi:hypothetical protein